MMLVHGPTGTGGDNKIDERTWDHLLTLLTERGKGTFDRKTHFCGVQIPETENHTWMIESARYLANEILTRDAIWRGLTPDPTWDNATNGQRQLILEQLRRLLVEDFYEFNSRPYQYLAVFAIRNLYELTTFRQNPNDPVPRAAEIVLDYLSARYALSSNGLRRVANFRRQPHRARYGTMFQAIGDAEFAAHGAARWREPPAPSPALGPRPPVGGRDDRLPRDRTTLPRPGHRARLSGAGR